MHTCPICGEEFLDSDEFLAHMQKHSIEALDNFLATLKTLGGSADSLDLRNLVEPMAELVAEKVLGKINPKLSITRREKVPEPKPVFEAIDLTRLAVANNKDIGEVVDTYHEAMKLLQEATENASEG